MGGQHLTWENRIAIESLLKAKVSASQIAAVVGCSKRTVYREIQRGQCEQLNGTTYEMYTIYSAQKAQNRADQMNDLHKGRPVKLCPELAAHLEDYIGTQHYSPAAAVREILLQGLALPQISANTVYRYIYRGYLHLCGLDLPVGRYNVKQKQGEQRPAKAHRNDRSIDERPPEVETREDVGFWEMDTVVGTSAGPSRCLLVLTERKTRFEIVRVLESKTAREVLRVLRELRQEFGEDFRKLFKTITCDNGCEFAAAKEMEQFAHLLLPPLQQLGARHERESEQANSPLLQKRKKHGLRHRRPCRVYNPVDEQLPPPSPRLASPRRPHGRRMRRNGDKISRLDL